MIKSLEKVLSAMKNMKNMKMSMRASMEMSTKANMMSMKQNLSILSGI